MDEAGERPFRAHAPVDVVDEDGIEIDSGELAHLLLNDPGGERVGAPDFEHPVAPAHHLGHEFVTREREGKALGIVIPGLARHQSEAFKAFLFEFVEDWFVLRLSRPTRHSNVPGFAAWPADRVARRKRHRPRFVNDEIERPVVDRRQCFFHPKTGNKTEHFCDRRSGADEFATSLFSHGAGLLGPVGRRRFQMILCLDVSSGGPAGQHCSDRRISGDRFCRL